MDFSHYAPLWGEALLTVLAVLIVLLGSLMKNSGKLMGYLSALGLVAALGLVSSNLMIAKPTLFFFDTISVDALSQFFKVVFLVVSLLVVIASLSKYTGKGADEYFALLLFATVGMMVVASSIDLITLFVGFELASLSTYALAAFDKSRKNLEAAMKYFIQGAIATGLFVFGMAILVAVFHRAVDALSAGEWCRHGENGGLRGGPAVRGFAGRPSRVYGRLWAWRRGLEGCA